MGCCLVAFIALFAPRIALFVLWVFTPYVTRAFHGGILWPLLGLVFLPVTTIIYCVLYTPGVGITGFEWVWIVLGVIIDLSSYGGGGYSRKSME